MLNEIGNRIRLHRERCKMTQEDLAKRLDVAPQTIFKYEQGIVSNIPLSKIVAMADVFNIPPARILGWDFVVVHDEEPAAGSDRRLTKNEEALLTLFRTLPPEAQAAYLRRLEESLKTLGLV